MCSYLIDRMELGMDKITFGGTVSRQISFALQQNYVPIFRDITLTNNTDSEICGVKLRITFEPAFAAPFTADVGDIPPGRSAAVSTVNTVLSADYLFGLTEKMVGNVTFEALSGDEVIAVSHENIELLAYDQWTGTSVLPETIAAFITPNHPKIGEIVSAASLYLKKWCGDPSFSGYQSHSANMVKMQMAAIYAALQEQNIAYIAPPASYENAQRVRMPDCVIERKSGTCLDLALLYCACLEYIDLNPLLFIVKGHAFAGCWLEEETFPDCLQYDLAAITKRVAKGVDAICAVECTDFVAGKKINFENSRLNAENKLNCGDDFRFAVDIRRTRAGGIRPIPSRIAENGIFRAADYGKRRTSEITDAPDMINKVGTIQLNVSGGEVSKIEIWERKLLDLSLRNSLLNFRSTAMNVQILSHNLEILEDEFAKGREFRICSVPADDILKAGDGKIFEIENHRSRISAIAEAEMKNHRLRTLLSESELVHVMTGLRRQAKISMEENGVNTVYLALGFLQWYETERSEKPRYAPLVLLPVDISRRIQDKSFSVKLGGDGAQINVTLLEMLRQNYGIDIQGLNKLPEDEHGINLPFIFATIRQSVMANPRWEVRELAFIGQFSFSRFIMWNDIRSRSDDLLNNKVTSAMITGTSTWENGGLSITPSELDRDVSPLDMAVPVAADSSQLAAVYAASKGQSFVLHGPPGTGKSQTITNIIADILYHDKTVLFVAEKSAALEVVHKRLKKIGLAPFCLELHSNKASKRSVLKQLEETLNTGRIKSPEDFAAESENFARLRSELNTVMAELHKPRSCGMSVSDAAVRYEQYAKFGGKFVFKRSQVAGISKDTYAKWRGALEDLAAAGREFGSIGDSPLKCCTLADWSPYIGTAAKDKLSEFIEAVSRVENSFGFMRSLTGGKWDFPIYRSTAEIIALAASYGDIVPEIIYGDNWDRQRALCGQIIAAGGEYTALKAEILTVFAPSVTSYDSGAALLKWNKTRNKWFIPRHFGCKRLLSELNAYGLSENPVNADNIVEYYTKLNRLAALENYFAVSISKEILAIFSGSGVAFNGVYTDWKSVERAVELSEKIREKILAMRSSPNEKRILAQSVFRYFGTNSAKSENREIAEKIIADHAALSQCLSELEGDLHIIPDSLDSGDNFAKNAVKQAENLISALPKIREWVGINSLCRRLEEIGIGNAAEKFLNGEVNSAELLFAFDCDLCRSIISLYVAENSVLSKFQGVLFEETIRKFGECTERFRSLTVNELAAKLSSRIPAVGEAAASSETGILQKAIRSGGRMMSIRRLFSSIPDLLRKMCPVMLMSPISAAQYIDRDYPKFDYVIFDEASQLPTCEAVGAMSRGENAIIVGDPKQLPPTSFFTSNRIDEECDKEDLESLLDDCLALSMPQEHLLWHYRSRHESLIAYSNMKYYDNKLYTFPSPDDRISKVSMVRVEGCYDKSSSRTNKAEAKAVVAEILRRLEEPELRRQSIGVVTFSMPQQNLIDDILTDAYRERPELEAMANEQYEPIIIKNLENVQGDERDVIMFSIGYGPDNDGKISMNFGPLNRDGGWRRLNVAISRARCRMIVFSSITADMIDLSRTRSEGVAGLKGFLKFAEQGRNALAVSGNHDSDSRSGFPEIIAAELQKRGYNAECGIGCSGFRVDVAVIDPHDPQRYILAIFCGTKNSFINNTAQDRHLAQTSILKGLGWNTINVHILDWIDNKEKAVAKIESAIAEITSGRAASHEKSENIRESADEPVFETEQALSLHQRCENYIPYEVKSYGTAENFNERNISEISACIMNILRTEAPISRNVLVKKLASCYDITRVTPNIRNVAQKAAEECSAVITRAGENEFVWLSEQDHAVYNKCRAVYPDGFKRSLDEISPEEISAAIKLIITSQGSMEREDLIRETARLFGFSRVSSAMESAVSLGIREARIRGYIEFTENGRIKNNF